MTSCKPVSFSRRTLHHGVSKCDGTSLGGVATACFIGNLDEVKEITPNVGGHVLASACDALPAASSFVEFL